LAASLLCGVQQAVWSLVAEIGFITVSLTMGVRTSGQMGSADPLEKWIKKLKSENMQKRAVFYVYVIF